ncbi:MAG: efflux RND transporter permease subunit [Rhodomicrobium sp.]
MTKAFIHSPLTLLFLIACLVLGVIGFMFTPRQEDPQIDVPMVDVFFQFPGASADQVASLATDPLERMMSEIGGVKHVYSASQRGGGMVTVEFDVGQKMEPSLVRLYDKLSSNMDKIPPGVSQPLVKPKAVDDVPVVTLTLWSDSVDDASLRLVALEAMQHLKEVRGTSQSFIVGGRQEELRVEVLPERLRGFGIGLDQLAGAIRAANERRDIGNVESAGRELKVYTGSFLHHAQDVERIVVGVRNNAPVYVRDVARVIEGPGEASSVVQYFTGPAAAQAAHGEKVVKAEGAAAVTIAIAKKSGTNGVTVAQDILDKVNSLKGRVIPDNVNVAVTRNYGKTANDKVNELFFKLTVATVAVSGLIYLFLGLRPMIVVGIIIPVVILLTVFGALLTGYTIDRVSLFALIFSIGILVDDATVVIENIYRRWLMHGRIDTRTTIDAVREVGNPTILATFTVIAALLPMGFVSGMMGPYMRPIPVLGSVAMLLSLFAAFMFTPWLAMRIRPSMKNLEEMEKREHRLVDRLDRFYRGLLGPLIDEPWKAKVFRLSIWAAFLACCALFYTENVSVKMLPMDNKPEFNIVVNMPDGTALPETANAIQQLVAKTKEIPEVAALQTYAGTASPYNFNGLVRHYYLRDKPWQGDIQVQLLDKSERKRSSHAIAIAARALLTPVARSLGARIAVIEMPPGPPVLQTVVAEVYGPDAVTRRQVARDLTHIFEKAKSIGDVDNYLQHPHDTLVFAADQLKAEHYNATLGDISRQLAFVMGGARLGDAKLGYELEPRPLVLQAPLEIRSNLARLGEVPVKTGSNSFVPLSELGSFVRQPQDDLVYHKDLRAIEYVTGEAVGALAAPVYAMIEVARLLHDYKTPDGVTMTGTLVGPPAESNSSGFEWTGEWTVTYETFRDMGLAFVAAIVLIYMLVVLEFGNFRLPGIIMAPIPLTLIGIIPGHWILGAEFTATSMIGWIALAGIIVRNSILLVDFSKHAILAGTPIREAVIQSCRARTRPIVITSLALMGGSASIITDPIFQGMAISLLFGAAVSTALTLVVIPLACARAQGAYSTGPGDFDEALSAVTNVAAQHAVRGLEPETAAPAAACVSPSGKSTLKERAAEAANTARLGAGKPLSWAGESIRALFGEGAKKPVLALQTLALAAWGFVLRGWRELFSAAQGPALAAASASPAPAASGSAMMRVTSAAARMPAPQAPKPSAPVASGDAGQESTGGLQNVPPATAIVPVEAAAGPHTAEVLVSSPATAAGALMEATAGPRTVELLLSSPATAAGPAPAQSEQDTAAARSTASEEPAGAIEPAIAALREEPGTSTAAGTPAAAVLEEQSATKAEAEHEHHDAASKQLALARRRRKALAKRAVSPAQPRRAKPAIDPKGED